MRICTRHFSIVGLPWSGIRSFARAFAKCSPDEWELQVIASHDRAILEPHVASALAVLVSHPTQWYRDLWLHRGSAVARDLGAADEDEFVPFCQATQGAYTRNLESLIGGPLAEWPLVRAENFNHDVRRALAKKGFEMPEGRGILPTLRVAHDEMAGRPIDETARAAADIVATGDPLFSQFRYRLDGERCGDLLREGER